jgi:hypothetical protein
MKKVKKKGRSQNALLKLLKRTVRSYNVLINKVETKRNNLQCSDEQVKRKGRS